MQRTWKPIQADSWQESAIAERKKCARYASGGPRGAAERSNCCTCSDSTRMIGRSTATVSIVVVNSDGRLSLICASSVQSEQFSASCPGFVTRGPSAATSSAAWQWQQPQVSAAAVACTPHAASPQGSRAWSECPNVPSALNATSATSARLRFTRENRAELDIEGAHKNRGGQRDYPAMLGGTAGAVKVYRGGAGERSKLRANPQRALAIKV